MQALSTDKFWTDKITRLLQGLQTTPLPRGLQPIEIKPHLAGKVRVSSLPFCPLLYSLGELKDRQNILKVTTESNFKSEFSFAVGHALHNLWQAAANMLLQDGLIGQWHCDAIISNKTTNNSQTITRCNRKLDFCSKNTAFKHKCLHPNKVSNTACRAAQKYHELEFIYKSISGHTDFIYQDKKGNYHLIDWKTSGLFLFDRPFLAETRFGYPNKKYLEQLMAYLVLIEATYKIKLTTFSIAYISRERAVHTAKKPALRLYTYKITPELRRNRRKVIHRYLQQHKIANAWLAKKSSTKKLWQARPCHSRRDYYNNMKHGFFEECPLLETCLSGKLKHKLIKLDNNRRETNV